MIPKFRCSRCRRNRPVNDSRIVAKTWRTRDGTIATRQVRVCPECASKSQYRKCAVCADQSYRVVGPKCQGCGLLYKDETVEKVYPVGQSSMNY